ncbi:FecR family protein, partial [Arenimonas composti]
LAVGVFGDRWRGPVEEADFRSGLGRIETVALSDGSRATLGTDSHISVRLDRAERRIALARGEGFFEVAKAPDRPFVVAAGSHEVIAVGTAFSVRRQDDGIRIVVTEGTVRLVAAGSDPGEGLLLPAGSVATTGGGGVLVRSQPLAEVARLVDWRNGFLVFQDSALAAAADEFNRYNARRLEIGDAAAGALRIGGSFRWDQLDSFVGLLEAGFPVCAARAPERIVLYTAGDPHCR